MKVTGKGLSGSPGVSQVPTPADSATAATETATTAPAAATELQSAVLQPALDAVREMPDIDQAKVEAIRDALARGEIPFNPARLAALIERYHSGRE
jgi:negative regulator of flagellin synthesis FlgM